MTPYYEEDGITIYHGDCFDVLPDLVGVGAVVTDPPYSSGGTFRGDRARSTVEKYVQGGTLAYRPEFAGDNRDQRTFALWSERWMLATLRSSDVGAVLLSFTDWRQLPTVSDAAQLAGWNWRGLATWWKPGCRMQHGRFSSSSEFVLYATNGPLELGIGSPQNVFSCAVDSEKDHIAQKPAEVMRWAMQVIPAGSLVLDPFMGSGATLRAAKDLGFKAVGIDVDERYCEIAARRLAQGVLAYE